MPRVLSARRKLEQVWWGVVIALGLALVAGVVALILVIRSIQ
jgi:hypothetical protein